MIAAPPSAPANESNSVLADSPSFGVANAAHASPGSSAEQLGLAARPQRREVAERPLGQAGEHRVDRHAVAVGLEGAGHRPELVDREERLGLLELLRGLGVRLGRGGDDRLEVDVVVAEAVVLEVVDRGLVAVGVGEAVAALVHVGRALEAVLGADDQEVADQADGRVLGVDLVVDAVVRLLRVRPGVLVGLLEPLERGLGRVGVLRRDDHRVVRLVGLEVGGPHAGVLAEPRREVLLPGEAVALLGERLVDLRAQLARGIVGAQELAGGGERVLAPVAGRLHRGLGVHGGAGGHERRRVGVTAGARRLAARGGGERQHGAGERERGGSEHRSSPF